MNRKNKSGFTLAEVLVTLAVIGIVAALAVPSLLNNTNNSQYKTGLKKSVALLNQTLQLKIARDGQDASASTTAPQLMNFFANEMRVIRTGANNDFYTVDGFHYTFTSKGGCLATDTTLTSQTGLDATATCEVLVDVNGDKGPGIVSSGATAADATFADQFTLIIQQQAIVPPQTGNMAAQAPFT